MKNDTMDNTDIIMKNGTIDNTDIRTTIKRQTTKQTHAN